MDKITNTATRDKETKGAIRYKEDVSDGGEKTFASIYLKKSTFGEGEIPNSITVTIEQ